MMCSIFGHQSVFILTPEKAPGRTSNYLAILISSQTFCPTTVQRFRLALIEIRRHCCEWCGWLAVNGMAGLLFRGSLYYWQANRRLTTVTCRKSLVKITRQPNGDGLLCLYSLSTGGIGADISSDISTGFTPAYSALPSKSNSARSMQI